MKKTFRSLLCCFLALIMSISALVGTTFAWFTDSVTSSGNIIKSGTLDIEMHWTDDLTADKWYDTEGEDAKPVFDYDKWEPGYTEVRYIKISNVGSLAFKYKLDIIPNGTVGPLAEVIGVYFAEDVKNNVTSLGDLLPIGDLKTVIRGDVKANGVLLPKDEKKDGFYSGDIVVAVALHMYEEAGNEYQNLSIGDSFDIQLTATQYNYENDSFDSDYDKDAIFPDIKLPEGVTVPVEKDAEGKTTAAVTMQSSESAVSALVPAGVKIAEGKDKLTFSVIEKESSDSNVTLEEGEEIRALDVHIEGIAPDNEVAMIITLPKAMKIGLNIGNYKIYHVENGQDVEMTYVPNLAEVDEHNEFYYDPATGDLTVAMKSFSEVAVIAEPPVWEGEVDHTWYDAAATELIIANADQLWSFSQIVGGMAKDESDNFLITYKDSDGDEHHNDYFEDKTVKLVADINLGDDEANNVEGKIFYPIGYWNSDGTYEKSNKAISSGFYTFQGTFDGNGNTISNFYQNTWEMKGDHDWYDASLQYFRDGMGLFGRVSGGTIKNLTVDNFSCDSEIGTTGVIAAYADSKEGKPAVFENISITNCNPRVYNIGNGGIVGCAGWYSRNNSLGNEEYSNAVTFRNITVDQTNKISALWGSWGVSCAGILGQYYPNSNCGIKLENCHVAAIIDVNNDVCSNYQYYWYRYAGMFIGTIRANTTDANGYTIADTTGVFAKDCTYTMGNWNEYWYCEIVANTIASYTHDHQFSRLDNIYSLSEISDDNGATWKKEGHFALLNEKRDIVDCYHIFKNSEGELYQHFHDVADESNPEIYEKFDLNGDGLPNDLKEDRQRYFIPFNQLLTGLDMGIKAHTEFEGIKFVENGTVKSEEKFEALDTLPTYKPGQTIKLGDIVKAVVDETKIAKATLYATVSPAIDNANTQVSATYALDNGNWANSTITFGENCSGAVKIVINDYFYCTPTVIVLNEEGKSEKFTANTVGEQNAYTQITLGTLFGVKAGATIGNVTATVTDPNGNKTNVTGTSSDWTSMTIDLIKDGSWTVVINDDDAYCAATTVTFTVNKVDKFNTNNPSYEHVIENDTINVTLGDIFSAIDDSKIDNAKVNVQITKNGVECVYTNNESDWKQSTLAFTGTGSVTINITDNNACNTATATVTISNPAEKDVFAKKFNNENFTYRIGNANAVKLGSLFSATDLPTGATVSITITDKSGNANGTYAENSTWSNGEIQFSGTGIVSVAIDSNAFTKAVVLELEVVDAYNTTSAISATNDTQITNRVSNNVVIINDISSGFTVSDGYTVHGNGFKFNYTSDGMYRGKGSGLSVGIVTVKDGGTLDNLQIICSIYPISALYSDDLTKTDSEGVRWLYQLSAVALSGNSTVSNCYVYGARVNILITGGNATVKNTVTECGGFANIHITGSNSDTVTLENVTTIQRRVTPTIGDTEEKKNVILGFGVVVGVPESDSNAVLKLTGSLKQYNWVTSDDTSVTNTYASTAITEALKSTDYQHKVDGVTTVNIGIAILNAKTFTYEDNRDNKDSVPYKLGSIRMSGYTGQVYSVYNSGDTNKVVNDLYNPTSDGVLPYISNDNVPIDPDVMFEGSNSAITINKVFDSVSQKWVNKLTIDLDNISGGTYNFSFNDILVQKYGQDLEFIIIDSNGNQINNDSAITLNSLISHYYTIAAYQDDVEFNLVFNLSANRTSIPKPTITYTSSTFTSTTNGRLRLAESKSGDWRPTVNALAGVTISYWSVTQNKEITLDLGTLDLSTNEGTVNSNVWTYTCDDFTLTLTGGEIKTGYNITPIVTSAVGSKNKLFYCSTNAAYGTTSANDNRTIKIDYVLTANNETVTYNRNENVNFTGLTVYDYSSFKSDTLKEASSPCVTPDTLVTLADGSQKRIDEITYNDQLLVWDFYNGKYAVAPAAIIFNHGYDNNTIIKLNFSDGTVVKVANLHQFYDNDLNRFVTIDADSVAQYVGHSFAKQNGDGYTTVILDSYEVSVEYEGAYGIISAFHYNIIVEGMISTDFMVEDYDLFNYFEVGEDMKYGANKMQADIEEYGLYTYEEFADYLTYEQFVAFNVQYFKISVGKGLYTYEGILDLIDEYLNA